jgi:hypothetical protein
VAYATSILYFKPSAGDRAAIEDAMNEYATRTCLRFEDRAGNSNIDNYILIRGDQSGYIFLFLDTRSNKPHKGFGTVLIKG